MECEFRIAKWAVYTTGEHKVFDHLIVPLTAKKLAERPWFHPTATRHLLGVLIGLGLLIKVGEPTGTHPPPRGAYPLRVRLQLSEEASLLEKA